MKSILPITIALFTTLSSQAQQPSQKLDQLKKDPAQQERAAKADVFIAKEKRLTDSTFKNLTTNKAAKKTRKGNSCKQKNK